MSTNLPVFYWPSELKQVHYPALQVNVSKYKQEVADLMEVSIEEQRRESFIELKKRKTLSPIKEHEGGHNKESLEDYQIVFLLLF